MDIKLILKNSAMLAATLILIAATTIIVNAQQELESTNYRILDPTFDSSGGVSTGTTYDLISSLGPINDARLESGTYAIGAGFPNGIQANVPLILCAESNTDGGSTDCLNFPNGAGAQGECGTPGCYDRVKIEVDHQNNPIDTLYLVSLTDTATSTMYYLQSDHTIDTTYDINDYQTICQLEGIDTRSGSGCENSSDPDWDADLQSTNVYGLTPGSEYNVAVRALSGDFTESQFSPDAPVTLEYPELSFDIDIADSGGAAAETAAPYLVDLGVLQLTPTTADDRIWIDLGTNVINGFNLFVKDLNDGLLSGLNLIPSQSEDLDVDAGNDGGYGLKNASATEDALGPIQQDATYNTSGANEVGGLSTADELMFFTNTTGSNLGQVTNGRVSILLKALTTLTTPAGIYTDTITFTMVTNI